MVGEDSAELVDAHCLIPARARGFLEASGEEGGERGPLVAARGLIAVGGEEGGDLVRPGPLVAALGLIAVSGEEVSECELLFRNVAASGDLTAASEAGSYLRLIDFAESGGLTAASGDPRDEA